MRFFIIINKYDDALLEFGQKIGHIFKLRNSKGSINYRKKPHGLWLNTGSSRSVCRNADALPFWHDEFLHFPGRTKT